MANPYGKLKAVNADNSRSRCKVVAYAADPVLQDRLVKLASPLTDDLIVGALLKADGTKATTASDIEPAYEGQESVVVAHPTFVILAEDGIEFNSMEKASVISKLQSLGFVIAGYEELAIPTT